MRSTADEGPAQSIAHGTKKGKIKRRN